MLNWKNTVLALSLASLSAVPAWAQDTGAQEANGNMTAAEAEDQARAGADQVIEEAVAALAETGKAIKALEDGDTEAATRALETAIGKLEVTLAGNPDLALAPVDVATSVIDIQATPDEIIAARNTALRLMKDHQLQLARVIVTDLASEVDITTTYIPLGSYPLALKSAAALIKDGQTDDAIAVLYGALSTLVVIETSVPLPLLNAAALIDEARVLSEKADRTDEENARLDLLLDALDYQIAKGEALEYGSAEAFGALRDEMKEIRRKLADGGAGEGFFDKLRGLFDGIGRSHAAATR